MPSRPHWSSSPRKAPPAASRFEGLTPDLPREAFSCSNTVMRPGSQQPIRSGSSRHRATPSARVKRNKRRLGWGRHEPLSARPLGQGPAGKANEGSQGKEGQEAASPLHRPAEVGHGALGGGHRAGTGRTRLAQQPWASAEDFRALQQARPSSPLREGREGPPRELLGRVDRGRPSPPPPLEWTCRPATETRAALGEQRRGERQVFLCPAPRCVEPRPKGPRNGLSAQGETRIRGPFRPAPPHHHHQQEAGASINQPDPIFWREGTNPTLALNATGFLSVNICNSGKNPGQLVMHSEVRSARHTKQLSIDHIMLSVAKYFLCAFLKHTHTHPSSTFCFKRFFTSFIPILA